MAEVADQRLPDVAGKRHRFVPAPLAPDPDLAAAPVHIVEAQSDHLTGAQSQANEHGEEGKVTPAYDLTTVATRKQAADLCRRKASGQRGAPASGDAGHRGGERGRRQPGHMQVRQQATEGAQQVLSGWDAALATLKAHESGDVPGTQMADKTSPVTGCSALRRHEQTSDLLVVHDRSFRQSPFINEVPAILVKQFPGGLPRAAGGGRRHDLNLA
jgi:hypothetical protein